MGITAITCSPIEDEGIILVLNDSLTEQICSSEIVAASSRTTVAGYSIEPGSFG